MQPDRAVALDTRIKSAYDYYGGFPLFMRFFRHCRAWPTASAV